jgi:hypothetical protein
MKDTLNTMNTMQIQLQLQLIKNMFRQVDAFFTALAILAVSIVFAPRSADLYIHSPLRLHDVVLNYPSRGTTLPLPFRV